MNLAQPQEIKIPPMRQIAGSPDVLPPADVVREKLHQHREAVQIRSGRLSNWFTTPLHGDAWTAWGCRAQPDKVGMTYMSINKVSSSPEPAEVGFNRYLHSRYIKTNPTLGPQLDQVMTPDEFGTPREIDRKFKAWIVGAAELAEEALDRQLRPTRHLRWEEMAPLTPHLERAFDQYATYLMQCQYLCSDLMGPWMGLIHYGFAEVKSYMAYELFDYNLHCSVLRKRILSNGGGMGVALEHLNAGIVEVCNAASRGFAGEVERDFQAMVFAVDVFVNGVVLNMLRLGEAAARSRLDQKLLRHMIQDNARHVAFGCRRLWYYLQHCPDREEAVVRLNAIADQIEPAQAEYHLLNPKVIEPLAILLGGGASGFERGMDVIRRFWPQFASDYLARLDSIGLARRDRCLIPAQPPF